MAELTAHDLDRSLRLRAVTDNLFFWQGLRFVALGPIMMLAGIAATHPAVHASIGKLILIGGVVLATFASSSIGRRYRREFGSVSAIPGAHRTRSLAKWLLVYPAMFGAMAVDLLWPGPILLSGPVWAGGILLYRRSTGGGRDHYFVLAAMLAALAPAPAALGIAAKDITGLMFLLLGAGFTVCAWLDDREMRRVLQGA